MFQFPEFASTDLCIQSVMTQKGRVSPFRYLRIKAYCQLPVAFRRLSRLSSPVIAKASTTCTYSLDPITLSPREPPKLAVTGELVFAAFNSFCASNARASLFMRTRGSHRTGTFTSSELLKSTTANEFFQRRIHK